MDKYLTNFWLDYPIHKGLLLILISIAWIIIKTYRNKSFNMEDYTAGEWKAIINSWSIILLLIISGAFLIFRNI
ncbi:MULTISPECIES: hypothetical protein [Croceibacter]|jgi:hypothetical protein|uniref:Uncharacterized protein n=1 Tax=Croceibacter atlanticus (strain ATCC BAA-628 / JCM 21780 / CIP 108009 / IAM 15332 / KCTC 12090 / HTCC2559) TaxID=216432 RepID=A3UBR6_CROAH|nr:MULTISPECIES: hypothetical protein [Croceibacter]EAP86067.1 hypothetical protein CA2559_08541 [Croceibacter atlanticus HTCC2559]MBG24664.1 hypothetical protein [Croceibacter sp.]MBW4969087.1 hypothetical protein [Croceibacter atlanticus]HAT69595.1 hypothetical protein [Flavobacteriaceae bacterium]|tara:strand:+ start:50260 stop:50481 length:222 start_codon:yes stop_codon:yes gene_type:complete